MNDLGDPKSDVLVESCGKNILGKYLCLVIRTLKFRVVSPKQFAHRMSVLPRN